MKVIENQEDQEAGRWKNNRCENSHLQFRRREYAMLRFRHMRSLQNFDSISFFRFQPFQQGTTSKFRDTFKVQREAALVEWQQLCAA